jgi:hypothetical protein
MWKSCGLGRRRRRGIDSSVTLAAKRFGWNPMPCLSKGSRGVPNSLDVDIAAPAIGDVSVTRYGKPRHGIVRDLAALVNSASMN